MANNILCERFHARELSLAWQHYYRQVLLIKLRRSLADLLDLLHLNNSLHFYNLGTFIQFPPASDRQRAHSLREPKFVRINQPSLINRYASIFAWTLTSYMKSPCGMSFSDFESREIERDSGHQSYLLQRLPYVRIGFDKRASISVSNKNVKAPGARLLASSTEQN
jgi:hypothetical protein